jgi:uncharacterized protein YceK
MRARWLLVPLAVVTLAAGCSSGSDDDGGKQAAGSTTTTSSSTTSTTVATTTTTAPFAGTLGPVDLPVAAEHTALLTKVTVEHVDGIDRVTFQFRDGGLPGVRAEYVAHPTSDGSGAAVKVEGSAYLQLRSSPAATADLTGETPVTTYAGPTRVKGSGTTAVTEVVRSGDFEGTLTWVVGVRSKAKFRVSTLTSPSRVVLEVAGSA